MVKERTIRKSKKKTDNNSAYFEYKSILGSSNKFWRIVKNDTKITTHYGKIGTLGQMTTKDYKSKVDIEYDKLIKSKKKKGYVESMDFGDKKPKPPTKIQREYMKICNKAENDSKLNPGRRNFDCEAMLTTGPSLAPQADSEIKWRTGWYKDALKNKEFDWDKLNEHDKSKKKKKKSLKGGRASADLLTKLQIKNMQRLKQCESKAKNKSQKKNVLMNSIRDGQIIVNF